MQNTTTDFGINMITHYYMKADPQDGTPYRIMDSTHLMFNGSMKMKFNKLITTANRLESKGYYVEVESNVFTLK